MARSLWGWGLTEKRPDLKGVASRAEAMFGELSPEKASGTLRLPAASAAIPEILRPFSDAGDDARARHTWGKSYSDRVRGFRGDYSAAPDFVTRPRTESELQVVLEVCEAEKLAAIPFGAGSSVVGGTEARRGQGHRGAVSVDLGALDRVLEVDPVSRLARIQAGVFGPSLEQQLGVHGFTLRHFPQSFEFSTLGGWIATRAGGHFATLYTHIDELVASARMLTPRGLWQSRTVPASGAGPDPTRLVCGSEGTLGVITEAWVRIRPKPIFRAGASVHFEDFNAAVDATRAIAQSGLNPSNCRLLDAQEAFLNAVSGDGTSVLVLAFESEDHPLGPWVERAVAIAARFGGVCPAGVSVRDENSARAQDAGESWRAAFLQGPYLQDAMIELGVLADTFETACTWTQFPKLYGEVTEAVRSTLERVCQSPAIVTCRFTHVYPDGPAPYFTFLGKARRGAELEQWAEVKAAASDALSRCGGTITHHHAVGRVHRPWFDRERPEPFALALRAAKSVLDPAGILNPGVLFD